MGLKDPFIDRKNTTWKYYIWGSIFRGTFFYLFFKTLALIIFGHKKRNDFFFQFSFRKKWGLKEKIPKIRFVFWPSGDIWGWKMIFLGKKQKKSFSKLSVPIKSAFSFFSIGKKENLKFFSNRREKLWGSAFSRNPDPERKSWTEKKHFFDLSNWPHCQKPPLFEKKKWKKTSTYLAVRFPFSKRKKSFLKIFLKSGKKTYFWYFLEPGGAG